MFTGSSANQHWWKHDTPADTLIFVPLFPARCYDACRGCGHQHINSFQAALNNQAVVIEFERETGAKGISKSNLGNTVTAAFYCLLFIWHAYDGKCDTPDVKGANFPTRNGKESVALFWVGLKKPAYMGSKSGCKNGLCVSSRSTRHIFQMASWLFEAEGGKIMHYFPTKRSPKYENKCVYHSCSSHFLTH